MVRWQDRDFSCCVTWCQGLEGMNNPYWHWPASPGASSNLWSWDQESKIRSAQNPQSLPQRCHSPALPGQGPCSVGPDLWVDISSPPPWPCLAVLELCLTWGSLIRPHPDPAWGLASWSHFGLFSSLWPWLVIWMPSWTQPVCVSVLLMLFFIH